MSDKKKDMDSRLPIVTEAKVTAEEEERPKQERSCSDSEITLIGERVATGFSVASGETYIRGTPLSKLGVD